MLATALLVKEQRLNCTFQTHCNSSLALGLNEFMLENAPRKRRVRFVTDKISQLLSMGQIARQLVQQALQQ